jgi:hypothetical protein
MVVSRKLKNLAEEFRRGIAAAIGVSPEEIKPEVVEKWVREWTRAFLTPEAFRRIWGHYSPTRVEAATTELMKHIKEVMGSGTVGTEHTVTRVRKGI